MIRTAIEIQPFTSADLKQLSKLDTSYVTTRGYWPHHDGTERLELLLQGGSGSYLSKEELRRIRKRLSKSIALAAMDGHRLIGFAEVEPMPNGDVCLWNLHVDKSCRQQGIGQRLFAAIVSIARQAKLNRLYWATDNVNYPAIEFYLKQKATIYAYERRGGIFNLSFLLYL